MWPKRITDLRWGAIIDINIGIILSQWDCYSQRTNLSAQLMKETEGGNRRKQGKTEWVTTWLVPRPYYSVRPNRFRSHGPSVDVSYPFASDTSLK